jgi:hypothetical protein
MLIKTQAPPSLADFWRLLELLLLVALGVFVGYGDGGEQERK